MLCFDDPWHRVRRPRRARRWASSGSSRSSTRPPATCPTTRASCSTGRRVRGRPTETDTRLHKELLRNTVEVVTGVCDTVPEAMADLADTLRHVRPVADELGVDLYSAGTHPFAQWSTQLLTPGDRYEELIERTQWWGTADADLGRARARRHRAPRARDADRVARCSTTSRTCRRCPRPRRCGRGRTPATPATGR